GTEYFRDMVGGTNRLNPASAAGVNGTGESSIGGVFSQTTWSYGIVDLITALRYDRYTLDGTFTATNAGGPSPIGLPPGTYTLDKSEGHASPKITLAAQVTPWLQPYVTYSE